MRDYAFTFNHKNYIYTLDSSKIFTVYLSYVHDDGKSVPLGTYSPKCDISTIINDGTNGEIILNIDLANFLFYNKYDSILRYIIGLKSNENT